MKNVLLTIIILCSSFPAYASMSTLSTKALECQLAESVYRQRDEYSLSKETVVDMLIASGFMDDVLSMPEFFQQRIFNIIDTAYAWRYPTPVYTPKSFAKSAFNCK